MGRWRQQCMVLKSKTGMAGRDKRTQKEVGVRKRRRTGKYKVSKKDTHGCQF